MCYNTALHVDNMWISTHFVNIKKIDSLTLFAHTNKDLFDSFVKIKP